MHVMEQPYVNILTPGQTLYMPAGQLHVSFSPEASIMHLFAVANWHASESDRSEELFLWMRKQIIRLMCRDIYEADYCLDTIESQLKGWKRVSRIDRRSDYEFQAVIEEHHDWVRVMRKILDEKKANDGDASQSPASDKANQSAEASSSSTSKRNEPPE
ncbi:hypothetical protein NDA13_001660 [Ustilago tritici]|nr:hypothetical protein NDA13_001660 [Ustilago tritici]